MTGTDESMQQFLTDFLEATRSPRLDTATDAFKLGYYLSRAQDAYSSHGDGALRAWVATQTPISKSTAYRVINVYKRLVSGKFSLSLDELNNIHLAALCELCVPS